MQTKHLFVLIHIRKNKDEVGAIKIVLSPPVNIFYCLLQGGTSIVDPFCYLCFVSVVLSCLFLAVCGHLLGKD